MRARAARRALVPCVLLVVLSAGCRSGRGSARHPDRQETLDANDVGTVLSDVDADERAALARLPELHDGKVATVGKWKVVAEPVYVAASGRSCRRVSFVSGTEGEERLACTEGGAWFFVPDVFGDGVEAVVGGE